MHRSLVVIIILSCIFTSNAYGETTRNCPADHTIQTVTLTDKTVTTLVDPTTSLHFTHNFEYSSNATLDYDEEVFTIKGKGTVTGNVIGKQPRMHLQATTGTAFNFDTTAMGEQLPTQVFTNPGFELDVELPFENGARNSLDKTLTPAPGMTTTLHYQFNLETCPR